jgi:hypothetical protein
MANNFNDQHQQIPPPQPDAIDEPVLEDLAAPADGRYVALSLA